MAEDNTARRYISRANPTLDTGSRTPEMDPLTELARLIGQSNPWEQPAPRAGAREQEWPVQAQPAARAADYRGGYQDDGAHYDQHQGYSPPPSASAYAEHHQDQHDPHAQYEEGEHDALYYGDNGELSPDDPYAQQDYDYQEPPRRRSGLITVMAVAGLALVGTGGAYAYRTFFSSSAPAVPPLIKADAGPNKIVPAQQSGEAANKQIYDRVGSGGGQTEKIVSREEQPMDVKPANTRPAYLPVANAATPPSAGQMTTAWPSAPGAAAPQQQQQQPPNPLTEPRKVRTVTIRPDQQGSMAPAPPPAAAAPAPSAPAATHDQSPAPAPARGRGPISLTPQAGERMASADPRAAARAPVTSAAAGGYVVQISAQKSEQDASAAFRSAQARYPDLLGNRQLIVKRKDVPGKGTYYGAQVGPFASRDEATQLCVSLKAAGGDCMVQKN